MQILVCYQLAPHAPGERLRVLHGHWVPHAERDVPVKEGKADREHMAGAELQGLAPCYSPRLPELSGLQG